MTATPNVSVRCSPGCASPAVYLVRDADDLRPPDHACLLHLGVLVAKMVGRYGAVVVEGEA